MRNFKTVFGGLAWWMVACIAAAGIMAGSAQAAPPGDDGITPVVTSACTDRTSGTLVLHYSLVQKSGTRSNYVQDRGWTSTVLKAPTDGTDRYFYVPSASGGENVRRVAGTYALTGLG